MVAVDTAVIAEAIGALFTAIGLELIGTVVKPALAVLTTVAGVFLLAFGIAAEQSRAATGLSAGPSCET